LFTLTFTLEARRIRACPRGQPHALRRRHAGLYHCG
jgi:hypothetical protein